MARSLRKRIEELNRQIVAIDESAGQEPADRESEEWFRWNKRRLDAMQYGNRGELVTERKRLQRQLDDISGGNQLNLFRERDFEQADRLPTTYERAQRRFQRDIDNWFRRRGV